MHRANQMRLRITLIHPNGWSANTGKDNPRTVLMTVMTSQKKATIKVLPVDDHPVVLAGVRASLRAHAQFDVVGVAANGAAAIIMARELSPDVVLMGVTMPGLDGFDTTRRLRLDCPQVKVLMFTDRRGDDGVREMIQCGARGCIHKSASADELIAAIEQVHRGESFFPAAVAQAFFDDYVRRGGRAQENVTRQISERERQVLHLIVKGAANKEAALTLEISVRTVEKHRQRIMKKLGVHKATELVCLAITKGLVNISAP